MLLDLVDISADHPVQRSRIRVNDDCFKKDACRTRAELAQPITPPAREKNAA